MNEKSEVSQIFQNFHSMIQTQFHTNIQILKTNNAKEYFNSKLNTYYLNQGILHIALVLTLHNKMEWQKGKIDTSCHFKKHRVISAIKTLLIFQD
jgi:uncharacterized protein (DUF2164 family)